MTGPAMSGAFKETISLSVCMDVVAPGQRLLWMMSLLLACNNKTLFETSVCLALPSVVLCNCCDGGGIGVTELWSVV
jgi:hypothetical protein